MVDTGSFKSYISYIVVQRMNLTIYESPEILKSELVDGSVLQSNKQTFVKFMLQNDQSRIYQVKATILSKMTTDMILGMDFLLSNEVVIDLNEHTINVNFKFTN
ncbi:hypothetical protein DMUE_1559 [Dictyocoela muelleri]|nr:hypothetical protein DMUE_1559 [Dictyocoela muelleri]